jgi:hypothetical protein
MSSSFWSQRAQTSMHKMLMVGRLCITHAPRYANISPVLLDPTTLRKGYLDIVRWLCERGGAAASVDGVHGVDTRSNGGWTPLSEFGWPRATIILKVF